MRIFKRIIESFKDILKYLNEPSFSDKLQAKKNLRAAIYEAQENGISKSTVDKIWDDLYRKRADEAFERLKAYSFLPEEPTN